MKRILSIIFLPILLVLFTLSCQKEAGEGGDSSIHGYVHVTDYNASFNYIQGEYDGVDLDVYIIYGDDISYGNKTKSGPDGKFEFKYLRKGSYKIYTYSQDSTLSGIAVVSKDIEITEKKESVDAGTFEIKVN